MSETLEQIASAARTDAPPAILLDKVNKWFGAMHVLRDVSLNVALMGLTIGLVNAGYQVVLPRDAVAGVPMDYAQSLIDGSYAFISTVVTTDDVIGAWA